jgi:hypothetical protein
MAVLSTTIVFTFVVLLFSLLELYRLTHRHRICVLSCCSRWPENEYKHLYDRKLLSVYVALKSKAGSVYLFVVSMETKCKTGPS